MRRSFFITVTAVAFLLMGYPTAAMMGGGHGHMQDYDSRDGDNTGRRPVPQNQETPAGHWHGDYYHSHEGGDLPHNHDNAGTTRETPQEQVTPSSESEPARQQVAPRPKKATKSKKSRKKAAPVTTGVAAKTDQAEMTAPASSTEKAPEGVPSNPLKATFQAKDEVPMFLVPGGSFTFPGGADAKGENSVDMGAFYMDETQVTNHQYVEFLNKVLPRIKAENGVVRGDGEIWLFLGEVREGYEPIVFEDGRFRVKGVHHAACAVLRVTGYGASAYARFYGKRLPSETEWLYAVKAGGERSFETRDDPDGMSVTATAGEGQINEQGKGRSDSGPRDYPPLPSPVILYPTNTIGVRGLNANVGEWGMRSAVRSSSESQTSASQPAYVVLGGALNQTAQEGAFRRAIHRYPWEAFADVGFRCVLDASAKTGEVQSAEGKEVSSHMISK